MQLARSAPHRPRANSRRVFESRLAPSQGLVWVYYRNHGPLLGPLNTRCRIIFRTQNSQEDPNFDNHPFVFLLFCLVGEGRWETSATGL